ncbi:PAQR family membrane homeostasis protein TrhA [Geminicoccus harenae]|uniref:PAQR family membrane homeostasis protein TrhA n=1 Tax=Geminicoccus harenae TaxID=2498453 RepID=UPI00210259D7|nr:hemolysin III family protein [Geminicoccus harenae]
MADAAVHLIGLSLAVLGCGLLAFVARGRTGPGEAAALALYGLGLVAMLGCSALYHLTRDPARKHRFRRLDHAAIFLMIAGTYTPLLVIGVGSPRAMWLLAFVWLVALAGMAIKLLALRVPEWLSVTLYLALGWAVLAAPGEIMAALHGRGLAFLAAGGIVYSIGVGFYLWERLRFHTVIWHLLVLLAAGCHYLVVLDLVPA